MNKDKVIKKFRIHLFVHSVDVTLLVLTILNKENLSVFSTCSHNGFNGPLQIKCCPRYFIDIAIKDGGFYCNDNPVTMTSVKPEIVDIVNIDGYKYELKF